jgi:DNA-binding transcriptional regulator YiaG
MRRSTRQGICKGLARFWVGSLDVMKVATLLHIGQNVPVTPEQLLLLAAARRHAKTGTGKTVRTAANLSLAEVGAAIGADQSTVWRWENNKTQPRGERAANWARLLADLADLTTADRAAA